jgi:hypothetical protein
MRSPVGNLRTIILSGVAAKMLIAVPAAAQTPRILDQSGNWVAFEAAGWLGYTGNAEDGSRFEITCDVAHTLTPGPGGVSVTIAGYQPGAGAEVRLSTTGQTIAATTAEQAGWIAGRGCTGCEETFRVLWSMLRSGEELVMESEGRRATLSLDGAATLLPPDGCPIDGDGSFDMHPDAAPASDVAGDLPSMADPGVVRRLQEALNAPGLRCRSGRWRCWPPNAAGAVPISTRQWSPGDQCAGTRDHRTAPCRDRFGDSDCMSVVRQFGTAELTEQWRVLAHRVEVMPRAPGGASGGFGWSAP